MRAAIRITLGAMALAALAAPASAVTLRYQFRAGETHTYQPTMKGTGGVVLPGMPGGMDLQVDIQMLTENKTLTVAPDGRSAQVQQRAQSGTVTVTMGGQPAPVPVPQERVILRDLPGMDMTLTGFSKDDLSELLIQLEAETRFVPPQETFDLASAIRAAERPKAPTRCQPGEVWALGRHRLLCGDSLEPGALDRLLEGRNVPIVLTDPPYGIDYESGMTKPGSEKERIANDAFATFPDFLERALPALRSALEPGGVLYWFAGGGGSRPVLGHALLAVARHFDLQNCLVWDKETPGLGWRWRRSWEAIIEASVGSPSHWHGGLNRRNVLRYPKVIPQEGNHPTPKPVGLLAELLRAASPPQSAVLDPFCGSGGTLIAADVTDRTCYAADLMPAYCELVIQRWESLTGEHAKRASGKSHA